MASTSKSSNDTSNGEQSEEMPTLSEVENSFSEPEPFNLALALASTPPETYISEVGMLLETLERIRAFLEQAFHVLGTSQEADLQKFKKSKARLHWGLLKAGVKYLVGMRRQKRRINNLMELLKDNLPGKKTVSEDKNAPGIDRDGLSFSKQDNLKLKP